MEGAFWHLYRGCLLWHLVTEKSLVVDCMSSCGPHQVRILYTLVLENSVRFLSPFDLNVFCHLHDNCRTLLMKENYPVSFLDRAVCNIWFEKPFNCGKSSMSLDGTNIKLQIFYHCVLPVNLSSKVGDANSATSV